MSSKCSFIPYKLRFFIHFRLVMKHNLTFAFTSHVGIFPRYFSLPGRFRFQGRLRLLPHPVPGVGCVPVLAIFETGLVCLREALFFPFRVMDISTHPALDIFFAHACFFHLIDAIVIVLIHLFSSQSVTVSSFMAAKMCHSHEKPRRQRPRCENQRIPVCNSSRNPLPLTTCP